MILLKFEKNGHLIFLSEKYQFLHFFLQTLIFCHVSGAGGTSFNADEITWIDEADAHQNSNIKTLFDKATTVVDDKPNRYVALFNFKLRMHAQSWHNWTLTIQSISFSHPIYLVLSRFDG